MLDNTCGARIQHPLCTHPLCTHPVPLHHTQRLSDMGAVTGQLYASTKSTPSSVLFPHTFSTPPNTQYCAFQTHNRFLIVGKWLYSEQLDSLWPMTSCKDFAVPDQVCLRLAPATACMHSTTTTSATAKSAATAAAAVALLKRFVRVVNARSTPPAAHAVGQDLQQPLARFDDGEMLWGVAPRAPTVAQWLTSGMLLIGVCVFGASWCVSYCVNGSRCLCIICTCFALFMHVAVHRHAHPRTHTAQVRAC